MNPSGKFNEYFQKFMRLPLKERFRRGMRFLRGLRWIGMVDSRALIDAGKNVKISKQHGQFFIDRYCRFGSDTRFILVGKSAQEPAVLSIGADTGIGDRSRINATVSVQIGSHCEISWDCDIRDTSWHRVNFLDRTARPVSLPVTIEDNVWIGSHTIIERGVTIGKNSVVAAGSRVTHDIPPNSLAAGNPAKVIKQIAGWDRNVVE